MQRGNFYDFHASILRSCGTTEVRHKQYQKLTILAETFNSTPWYITPTRNTHSLTCKVLYKDMSQMNETRTEA